jgi:hypothetical protein
MSSIDHIHMIPGFRSGEREWPVEMSPEQNLADLDTVVWHAVSAWLEGSWPFAQPFYRATLV